MRTLLAIILVLVLALIPAGIASAAIELEKIYWGDISGNGIYRANPDGSGIENVVAGTGVGGIALDTVSDRIFWNTYYWGAAVKRANMDGTDVVTLIGSTDSRGIALDLAAGKVYWTDIGAHKIARANLDGTGAEDVVTSLLEPVGLAIDGVHGKVYWTDFGAHTVQRANLNGTGVETLVTTLYNPYNEHHIALDVNGGKMYWVENGGRLRRANLDGTNVEVLLTGIGNALGVALDLVNDKVYWASSNNGIHRANLDGTSPETVLGSASPFGIALEFSGAVVPEPCAIIIWSLLGAFGVAIGWWRRRQAG